MSPPWRVDAYSVPARAGRKRRRHRCPLSVSRQLYAAGVGFVLGTHRRRVATANVSLTCAPPPASVTGSIVNSAGGYISGATITVTPTGSAALPAVMSQVSGTFVVSGVTVGPGTGAISVSNVPATCTAPAPVGYSGLVQGGSISTIVTVTCTAPTALSLAVGQSAIYGARPSFQTELVMPANSQYLITVVNTDTTVPAQESFTLTGATAPSTMLVRGGVTGRHSARAPPHHGAAHA